MLEQLARWAQPLLTLPVVRRTRRNHGLEHATITVLSRRQYRLSGRSSDSGFVLLGDVPTEDVAAAAREALRRMRSGEHGLAVHPNCGTNLVTTGFLASLVGLLSLGSRRRESLNRLPLVMVLMMGVLLYAPLLGMNLQKHFTTEGDPGDLEIIRVSRSEMKLPFGPAVTVHRVETRSS